MSKKEVPGKAIAEAILPPGGQDVAAGPTPWARFCSQRWPMRYRLQIAQIGANLRAAAGVISAERKRLQHELFEEFGVDAVTMLDDKTQALIAKAEALVVDPAAEGFDAGATEVLTQMPAPLMPILLQTALDVLRGREGQKVIPAYRIPEANAIYGHRVAEMEDEPIALAFKPLPPALLDELQGAEGAPELDVATLEQLLWLFDAEE